MFWTKIVWLVWTLQEHGKWFHSGGEEGRRANLRDANLRGAYLRGAYLRGAYLGGAYLGGANLRDAIFEPITPVSELHTKMLRAIDAGGILEMSMWHGSGGACGTTHCRAGWAIHLAGEEGEKLEAKVGPEMAGYLITRASCPWITERPDFHCSNEAALEDIRLRAAEEAARKTDSP